MRSFDSIPQAPGAVPVLGHAHQLLRDPLGFLRQLPAHGNLVRVRIGMTPAVIVCDADLTRQVLLNDRTFDKGGTIFNRAREFFGDGLVTCPHHQHLRQRRLLQPAFSGSQLVSYTPHITTQVTAALTRWQDGQIRDIRKDMCKLTTRSLLAALFSDTTLAQPVIDQITADLDTLAAGVLPRILTPPFLDRLPIPGKRRYEKANRRLRHHIEALVADRRNHRAPSHDLLEAILANNNSHDVEFSNTEIIDQVVTFVGAGTDTVATALTWAIHLMETHQHFRQRLQAEADSVLAGHTPTHQDLAKLPETTQFILETLRYYPPAWLLSRIATSDTSIADHSVPAGTHILYSAYLVQHRPDLFPQPETFNPDRWSNGAAQKPPRQASLIFGAGARKCIGDQFALNEAVLTLAAINRRWTLAAVPATNSNPKRGMLLQPTNSHMRLTSRNDSDADPPRHQP